MQKEYDNIHLPHRKPKGGALSAVQKEENRALSQSRVVCGTAFAGVKRYNAVSVVYLIVAQYIFKLNRTRMFYYEQNFRQSLVFTRHSCEDTDDAWEDEDSEAYPDFCHARRDNRDCDF